MADKYPEWFDTLKTKFLSQFSGYAICVFRVFFGDKKKPKGI